MLFQLTKYYTIIEALYIISVGYVIGVQALYNSSSISGVGFCNLSPLQVAPSDHTVNTLNSNLCVFHIAVFFHSAYL